MIKAIIFDLGGVVYTDIMNITYEKTGKKFNIDPKFVKEVSRSLRIEWQKNKISSEEFWRQLAAKLKISDTDSLKKVWDEAFFEGSKPNEEIIKIIENLKERKFKVAVLSNTVEPHASYHKDRKDYDLFPFVFLSSDLGIRKPEKEIYEHVVKTMKVKFDECIFIDDKEVNLVTARRLGMKTIFFKSSEQLERELKKLL